MRFFGRMRAVMVYAKAGTKKKGRAQKAMYSAPISNKTASKKNIDRSKCFLYNG